LPHLARQVCWNFVPLRRPGAWEGRRRPAPTQSRQGLCPAPTQSRQGDVGMLGFNRILLATDFSAGATAALQYAAMLAHLSHATLQILHVIDTRVAAFSYWTDIFRSTEVLAAQEAQETAALQKLLAHSTLTGLPVEWLVRHGHPADNIIDVTANADLVVMGTQGTTTATSRAAGKVARQVAHGS